MADLDLLRFHAQSLRDYATLWFDPEARQEDEVSEEEAAYHLCEHAAMLARYTAQDLHLQGLVEQPPEGRRALVLAVCRYLTGFALTATARRLLSQEILEAEQLTELEDLLIERDSLEEVLTLASRLSADLLRDGDSELRRELAVARCIVAELDDVLWERPDAVSVACRALAGLRTQLAVAPVERTQWWFKKAVELDEAFDEAPLEELLESRAAFTHGLMRPEGVIRLSASLLARRQVDLRLAAADAASVSRASALPALIPELPGTRAMITQLDSDTYQFVFVDEHTRERSTLVNGHRLIARRGNENQATSTITDGVAVLRACGDFDSCQLETTDGHLVGTMVVDTSDWVEADV